MTRRFKKRLATLATAAFAAASVLRPASAQPPPPFPERPPLGAPECLEILRAVEARLAAPDTEEFPDQNAERAALGETVRYLDRLASASLERVPMRWTLLEKLNVGAGPSDTDSVRPDAPLLGVSALRLHARRGDVHVRRIRLTAVDGGERVLEKNLEVAADLPRRPVIFLTEPIDLAEATVVMQNDGERPHRLVVETGVRQKPDLPRAAAGLCRRARRSLADGASTESLRSVRAAVQTLERLLRSAPEAGPRAQDS